MRGFSLVELSIVLVILGLLTGGILAGQSLIRAAELRSVTTDVDRYKTAIHAFRDKYFYLPGDMPNAVRIWGAQAGGLTDGSNNTCAELDQSNPATSRATCNGNGNGRIAQYGNMAYSYMHETFRSWQHLANAGLIEGSYAGVTNSPINVYADYRPVTAGWNVPASRVSTAAYSLVYYGNNPDISGTSAMFLGEYGHVLVFGAPTCATHHCMNYGAVLTPEAAWNIDTKGDDGLPHTGAIVSPAGGMQPNCTTTTRDTYRLSTSSAACGLVFKLGF